MRKYVWGIGYGLVLFGFTLYVLLDAFVISRVYQVVEPETKARDMSSSYAQEEWDEGSFHGQKESERSAEGGTPPAFDTAEQDLSETPMEQFAQDVTVTENTYQDERISIILTQQQYEDTWVYVAEVYLRDAQYLKTAFAQNAYGRNITEKTSEMAQTNGAILAINGDNYGAREGGYVLRNGQLYRESAAREQEDLVIWEDGTFSVAQESEVTAQALLSQGAYQVFSFGPALIQEGKVTVSPMEEVGKAMASNPRTAIGVLGELHYVFVVSDGRTRESEGLSLYQLAQFMDTLGVQTAYNLDGGGSSAMVFNGRVINNPTTNGRRIQERSVSDIVYIG